jgi:uncharacterized protein YdiU (UPF0061 family)
VNGLSIPAKADQVPKPQLLVFNDTLADELGLPRFDEPAAALVFSGQRLPPGISPSIQAYAGHQFGHFNPGLGDGRALLLGEAIDPQGQRRDIQLKGSGPTRYSRRGDGKSALGPVLREYLVSEFMHAMGIPSTRALAAVATGELVFRETRLPGAILTRVAASHIRVGSFEYLAIQPEGSLRVKQLADHVIDRHYPALRHEALPYPALLEAVIEAQAHLIARWMSIGFVHGVMNTDNTSIAGETIDFGPCAFMDAYNEHSLYSSIDHQGRYAYANQPLIARWNMARLAETLLPLLHQDRDQGVSLANVLLESFMDRYHKHWLAAMRAKLGLSATTGVSDQDDATLIARLLALMQIQEIDFTRSFRLLSAALGGDAAPLRALFKHSTEVDDWLLAWQQRGALEPLNAQQRAKHMNRVNPISIPRNHQVEAMIAAAVDDGDLAPFHALLEAVTHPFEDRPEWQQYAQPAPPSFGCYTTFCGT